MRSLTAWLEDGYRSITVADHGLIMLIGFVTQSCTSSVKKVFADRLHLALHACKTPWVTFFTPPSGHGRIEITCKGAHGAVAKATAWGDPTQGSIPGCCTICGEIKRKIPSSVSCAEAPVKRRPRSVWGPCVGSLTGYVSQYNVRAGPGFGDFLVLREKAFFLHVIPRAACPSQVEFFL
jgi:hypothetical protein